VPDLGGDDEAVAPRAPEQAEPVQAVAEEAFGAAVAVDVGVVEVVHAGVEPGPDAGEDVVLVHVGPADLLAGLRVPVRPAHGPAAEADLGDADAGAADASGVHAASVVGGGATAERAAGAGSAAGRLGCPAAGNGCPAVEHGWPAAGIGCSAAEHG